MLLLWTPKRQYGGDHDVLPAKVLYCRHFHGYHLMLATVRRVTRSAPDNPDGGDSSATVDEGLGSDDPGWHGKRRRTHLRRHTGSDSLNEREEEKQLLL